MAARARIGFGWQTSIKTPGDYSHTLCNAGDTNGDIGFILVNDNGQLARSNLVGREFALNEISGIAAQQFVNRASGSCTNSSVGTVNTLFFTGKASLIGFHDTGPGDSKILNSSRLIIDQAQEISIPPSLVESVSVPAPDPEPTPTPIDPPQPVNNHYIVLNFAITTERWRPLIAAQQLKIKEIVDSKLGSKFDLSAINVSGNQIEILITEFGNRVIPLIIIAAIIAVVLLIIGGAFFIGYVYRENQIIKATNEALSGIIDDIEQIINDPNKTDEQKLLDIGGKIASAPTVVIPPSGGGFDLPEFGIGAGIGGTAIILVAVAAFALSRK